MGYQYYRSKFNALYNWLLLVAGVVLINFPAVSQPLCLENLDKAEVLYREGKINEVHAVLDNDCLRAGLNHEQKIRAYELLILSSLYLDNNEKAAREMLALLKFEKEYVLTSTKPNEFKKLYNAFRTHPIMTIGLVFGPNISPLVPQSPYSVGMGERDAFTYSNRLGFQVGFSVGIHLTKNVKLNFGASFLQQAYGLKNQLFDFTHYNLIETQNWFSAPFSIQYEFSQKKVKPFVNIGGSYNYLSSANVQIERSSSQNIFADITGQDLEVSGLRTLQNYTVFSGFGIKVKMPQTYFTMEARYGMGQLNQVNTQMRNSNRELVYRYGHIDPDFKLNNIALLVGVQYCIYRPKKVR